ncbi:MAG: ribosome recycling factor [Bacteroidota bacterium]|jgi:ribosome recycling factor|nr:ribosome recycling factor [Ignavibacteria bacterium]MCU7499996.1 ribosome recycling factor [Ignavibacteria bacterium]MCU7514187.1 ribosome recycling factor [Ignavibacteria bacterium]MCU7519743.1 ribosome recycling factor [Ignavibacteria bacterium]MCU7526294.1 ribosome recycling factor [Ignavibacteria bacterium]
MNQTISDARQRMDKSIEAFRTEISKIRSGKATTALLDGVKVDYYGTLTPLKQMANVSVLDAHTLSITPWDRSAVQIIEKAIMTADLGLNPSSDGTNIRVPIPMLTEERRKDLMKIIKKMGEDAKVAIRNVRRDANEHLKKEQKEKKISEDDLKNMEQDIQKFTNDHTNLIDEIIKHKEKEIMEV